MSEIKYCINCRQALHEYSPERLKLPYCLNEACSRYGLLSVTYKDKTPPKEDSK